MMLTLKLVAFTDQMYTYHYYPEGRTSTYGVVVADLESQSVTVVKLAADDQFRSYSTHAWARLREYLANAEFHEEDLVAWG